MCVLIAGATEYVKFFISVLMLCDMVWSYVVSLSEVIRAAAETSLLNHENKYLDVTFVLDECKLFSAHKGSQHPTNNDISDINDILASDIRHVLIWQYGCQKKRQDL